jgi:hypothetical protein
MSTLLLLVITAKLGAWDYVTFCLMHTEYDRLGEANLNFEIFEKRVRVQ